MKKIALIFTVFCVFLLCGCTGYREIDRGYLVTAIGFAQDDNGVTVFLETMSSSDVSDAASERLILSSSGKSPDDALQQLKTQLVKPLYFEQLGAVVFEDSISATNQTQISNFLKDNSSISWGIYFVKTPNAATLFDTETHSGILGYDIIGLIKNFEKSDDISLSNRFYQQKRNPSALPTINVTDGNLIFEAVGDKQ